MRTLEKIGGMLKSLRKEAGLTQVEASKIAGISVRTLAYWEGGEIDPPYSAATRMLSELKKRAEGTK